MPKATSSKVAEPVDEGPSYTIDLEWWSTNPRSFDVITASRFCATHQQERTSAAAKGAKRKAEKSPFQIIKTCCSRKPEFFHPNMSVMEAVFRILLANENKAMTAKGISERLVELGLDLNGLRDVSPRVIERLIQSDRFYGLALAKDKG